MISAIFLDGNSPLLTLAILVRSAGVKLQRVCKRAITATFHAVTRHAGNFVFDHAKMIVIIRMSIAAKPQLERQCHQKDGDVAHQGELLLKMTGA